MNIEILDNAWHDGQILQYFQTLGYDSEWTDYTSTIRPDFSNTHLVWRIKIT